MEIRITFGSLEALEKAFEDTLSRGGAFADGCYEVSDGDEVELALVHPADGAIKALRARVVWVVPQGHGGGVGLEIVDFTPELRDELAEFITVHSGCAAGDEPDVEQRQPLVRDPNKNPLNVHERLRNLSVAEQHRIARDGDVNERIVLERIYGKHVWESLVRNPRLTAPEICRIVRMPALPRPLLEQIVGNPGWLSSPQVRRALLANRRLSTELVTKVLRVTPKTELKLAVKQTAYPSAVRELARKLLGT